MAEEPPRKALNEDWPAVIVGLALFALALTGVVTPGLMP